MEEVELTTVDTNNILTYLGMIALFCGVIIQIQTLLPDTTVNKISKSTYSAILYCACRPIAWYHAIVVIIRDFRNRKYYKPWKSTKNITIVSTKHVKELSEATELSQRAVYADMFGFKHTMNGIEHNKTAVSRSRLFSRLLQVNGPGNLAIIFSSLRGRLHGSIQKQLNTGKQHSDGWVSVPLCLTIKTITSDLMSAIFFGEELSSDPEFTAALLQYPKDMISSMMAFQITPSFLSSAVHAIVTKGGQAMLLILHKISSQIRTREEAGGPFTILRNMVKLTADNDYWTPEIMAQALLGIWFAASHQPWMNLDFVILELCSRQDFIDLLREEIGDFTNSEYSYEKLENLPLLDSFIKETIRLSPLDTLAIRRKALRPFKFTDGPVVPVGTVTCISSYDAMHDPATYSDPNSFDGQRFLGKTRLTDVSEKFPVWGFGSLACPGRFHASLVMKMWVAYFVSNFEFKLEDEKKPVRWMWETFTMPYQSTRVLIRHRSC